MPNPMRAAPLPALGLPACLLACLLGASPALAHAILVESMPAEGAALPAGHAEIRLRFNSRIDAARSRVSLTHAGASTRLALGDAGRPDVLTCPAELSAGAYVLHWQVLAVDGHITRGAVDFTVAPAGGGD